MNAQFYMMRALELAALGGRNVSPNPMVGCVIVWQDKIIGEGWHKEYGGPHAEVNAINNVRDKALLKESTVYVTLEPCAHYGKTPPCADLLISHAVKKVVIGTTDLNPLVEGKGIKKMKAAGIQVETGLLEAECRIQNKRFFTSIVKGRPHIMLKWAETADGYIARKNFDSKWISSSYSRRLVHKWRGEEDAILVGTNTARYDNPKLNVRDWIGKNPVRIVIDRNLRLEKSLHLFDQSQNTLCYNQLKQQEEKNLIYLLLGQNNFVELLLKDLNQRKINALMVEGGAGILNAFIQQQFWDEIRIFKSKQVFGDGISAPKFFGTLLKKERLAGGDDLFIYTPDS